MCVLTHSFRWLNDEYPKSDDVNEYVQENPLHIPFSDVLFGDPANGGAAGGPLRRRPAFGERMRTVTTTNWARYTGNVI